MRNAFAGDPSGFRYNPCDFYFSLSNFSAVPLFDPSMRKAVLLYNPLSGRRHMRRLADVEAALTVLRQGGVEATLEPTRGQADATGQARQAIAGGCDAIFACGGDGTVHDVLQGMVGSNAALGVIPLGTANALAHDLRLPLSAMAAARASLTASPRRTAVGQVEYVDLDGNRGSRFFIVTAGIGADAHLFYKLNPRVKGHLGMAAYYAKATRLWLTHRMENFVVEMEAGTQAEVSQLLAVRIRNFGGVLRELAPGASLERDDLRLVLFRTRSRWAYLQYIVRGLVGAQWRVHGIELVHSVKAGCRACPDSVPGLRIFVEADGELLGTLPVEIRIVPDAVTLLVPAESE
jgi:YegS/Rv2252/BmrU family lipid kinase